MVGKTVPKMDEYRSLIWIWQQPNWPHFVWQADALSTLLREVTQLQGKLLGKTGAVAEHTNTETQLDTLLQNIIQSSAIEGEILNAESVRSSLAKRLGVEQAGLQPANAKTEGLADLMLDSTQNYALPLTQQRLLQWHRYLFPKSKSKEDFSLSGDIRVGELRGEDVMQVVSGPINKRKVHFEAPPREGLEKQLAEFLTWLKESELKKDATDNTLDPLIRAGIAHLWFVTLHPFDDGNGRLARAITDYALAQAEHQAIRFYAMSASIMEKRQGYYNILESTQKGDLDITAWLSWFLQTLKHALESALTRMDWVLQKAKFWQIHAQDGLNTEQIKVLNRLLDAGPTGFESGLNATKYQGIANVSKATATRHLADLLEKKCLIKLEGGGRSTRYNIHWP